ncbi:MAG TPA: ATP-binding protein [Gemmatimonadales bacterium]|nr:ATP-binding protein [Gemmatimonadales bacterium]
MGAPQDDLNVLRDRVRANPDDVDLRCQLAERLLSADRLEEAESEFKEALRRAPDDAWLKVGLARTFYRSGKSSAALVVLEDVIRDPQAPAPAHLLLSRLALQMGEVERAVTHYKRAVARDPEADDPELRARLGIGAASDDEVNDGRLRAASGEGENSAGIVLERPKITFADVGGMDGLKDEIQLKIVHPLRHPELYAAYGKSAGGAILLYGPPGCGKTFLARATAGEVGATFLPVGLNDVLDMWIGQSERNLHAVFEQARESHPCVLFFDEVDALAASRSDFRGSAGRQVINQFLSELDGVQYSNTGVLILAATNAPWHIDQAFRRPGRFDQMIFVPPPDGSARAAILRLACRAKPQAEIEFEKLATKTEGFSGADLVAIVDKAVDEKLRRSIKSGKPEPLTTHDLVAAAKITRPSTRDWFATARNYVLYANESGFYDAVRPYLKL